mmetsp:Transcript_45336/g.90918  ORF Transcript_45336/g.90918 Transcript_45336/m.90918 type:complete len:330 (+) Transcript_45336:56-1045(+)
MDRFTPVAVCVTLALDIGFNSILEPKESHVSIVILLTCLQVAMPLCTQVFLLVLFMRTRLLQLGNFRDLYKRFRPLFIISPLHMALLLAVRGYRIEALAKDTPWVLTWDLNGFLALYVVHKLVTVLFYFVCYQTLLGLGDPDLYFERTAPDADSFPEFARQLAPREFRSVPQIIRGSVALEAVNEAVEELNRLVVEKYQLLAAEPRELQFLRASEEALEQRKAWEAQQGIDTHEIDCFADTDLQIYPQLAGDVGRDMLQVLKHLNIIVAIRSTRTYTLYANQDKKGEVQEWAKKAVAKIKDVRLAAQAKGGAQSGRSGAPPAQAAPGWR